MKRSGIVSMAGALVVAMSLSASAVRADSVGSQGFADTGSPTVNTGDINTATIFNIGDMISTGSSSGVFAGLPTQDFGAITFDITNPTSLTFGNAVFGIFTSSSITETVNSAGQVAFYVVGDMTGGTFSGPLTPSPAPASFTISFTQTPAGTGSISDSGTLSVPPSGSSVPEPSSIMLVGLGIVSMGTLAKRKRQARA